MSCPSPEGRLKLRLADNGAGGCRVELVSSRPLGAARWFVGRAAEELPRLIPLVFSICANAQALACVRALEQARDLLLPQALDHAREALVLAETAREHLLRIGLGWSAALQLAPRPDELSAATRLPERLRTALFGDQPPFAPGQGRLAVAAGDAQDWLRGLNDLLAAQLRMPAAEWLNMCDLDALREWAAPGGSSAAEFIRWLLVTDPAAGAPALPALPPLSTTELDRLLGDDGDGTYVAAPSWHGDLYETGAFARVRGHPLVKAAVHAAGAGLLARSLARLVELAELPARIHGLLEGRMMAEAFAGNPAESLPPEVGIGQVEAARGRLVHRAVLRDGKVADYRILAPTEWNFHPRGVLVGALGRLPQNDDTVALAGLMVEAVDPCVGYDIELSGHA